jgi:hypothetical protein
VSSLNLKVEKVRALLFFLLLASHSRSRSLDMAQVNSKTLQAPIAAFTMAGILFLCKLSDEQR